VTDVFRRTLLVASVVVVVAGVALIDRTVAVSPPPTSQAQLDSGVTQVAAAGVESSAWYCTGGSGASGGAPAKVLLSNVGASAVSGTLTAFSSSGVSGKFPVYVPAHASSTLVPAGLVPGAWVAATIELDGGSVGATEEVSGPQGWSEAPCASSTSSSWYFSHGSTLGNDDLELSLFNPTATSSSVDVDLVTTVSGALQPPAYQEIQVPARSVVNESLADHAQQDPATATEVFALSGSVVATELEMTGQAPASGLSLMLGTPSPAASWSVPISTLPAQGRIAFHVFNPSGELANVDVVVKTSEQTSSPLIVPVKPDSATTIFANSIPFVSPGVPFTASFQSRNGVGVVVDRQVVAAPESQVPQRGTVPAVSSSSDQWLVPHLIGPGTGPGKLAIQNVSGRPIRVTVYASGSSGLVEVANLSARTLEPGTVLVDGPTPPPPSADLVVEASGPVNVELDTNKVGAAGVVVAPALPMG